MSDARLAVDLLDEMNATALFTQITGIVGGVLVSYRNPAYSNPAYCIVENVDGWSSRA